jgi:toxin-antitoxin system PIN domain toxin
MTPGSHRVAEASPPWGGLPGHAGDLPDLNIWLALVVAEHPHHAVVRRYWDEAQPQLALGQSFWFCRMTMLGLVRLLSQPKVMGEGALPLHSAHATYRQMRATEGVAFLKDSEGMDATLPTLIGGEASPLPPRLWSDVWLAAAAESAGLRLVTLDSDFKRFGLSRCLVLQP